MTERLLRISEAAELVNEPASTMRRWVYDGLIPVERVGPTGRVRIRLSTLARMYPADCFLNPSQTVPIR